MRSLDHSACRRAAGLSLASYISHGINNALNLITLNVPLIQDIWADVVPLLEERFRERGDFDLAGMPWSRLRADIPELFDGLCGGTNRVREFLLELRESSGIRRILAIGPVDLAGALRRAAELAEITRTETAPLVWQLGPEPLLVKGDAAQLAQALLQLLDNAHRAQFGRPGTIRVATAARPADGTCLVTVEDEGAGIDEAALPQLTRAFYSAWPEQPSLGLGLTIASRIAVEHGGHLSLRSGAGRGFAATLTLPLLRER